MIRCDEDFEDSVGLNSVIVLLISVLRENPREMYHGKSFSFFQFFSMDGLWKMRSEYFDRSLRQITLKQD